MHEPLESIATSSAFEATVAPYVLLDPGLRIRAVNRAYLDATHRHRAELLGQHIFEAFPDNPGDPHANGVRNLAASLDHVLSRRQRHNMWIQRYDVPHPDGGFLRKIWSPVNSPIPDDRGQVAGILHHVEDITALETLLVPDLVDPEVMEACQDVRCARAVRTIAIAAKRYVHACGGLARQNRNLREALTSRSTIDQAKGVIMAEHHVGPDAAFELMTTLSQNWNVRLRDVAAALVYHAAGAPGLGR